jgi:hypothetical protein
MRLKVKSQLDHVEKGGILDDCGPSSTAAAVAWASGYTFDPTAGDGIAAKKKATGQKDVQGVSDNGSSLPQLIKTAEALGARARTPKSWEDIVGSAQNGAGILVWVQQPVGYPKGVEISEWHKKWAAYWQKKDAKVLKEGYGHMTAAAWCEDHGWQWACPTRSGKGKEQFAVQITEDDLKKIAGSKKTSGKSKGEPWQHCVIVKWDKAVSASTPTQTPPAAQSSLSVAPSPVSGASRSTCSTCGCALHPSK